MRGNSIHVILFPILIFALTPTQHQARLCEFEMNKLKHIELD